MARCCEGSRPHVSRAGMVSAVSFSSSCSRRSTMSVVSSNTSEYSSAHHVVAGSDGKSWTPALSAAWPRNHCQWTVAQSPRATAAS